jgi:2-C-methyl-D-erythritol 4-phosphate cytidylyltransferase
MDNQHTKTALTLIIPAAGSGKRFGGEVPKPFVNLNGKPILWHTLNAFIHLDELKEIIIARHPDYDDEIVSITNEIPSHITVKRVEGGSERQDSILNALNLVDENTTLVAVHDAVRPFPSKSAIERTISVAAEHGAALMGHQPRDTIKEVKPDGVVVDKTLNRSSLVQCQTPQIFHFSILRDANKKASQNDWKVTDDASIVEMAGYEVRIVDGNTENIKITYPHDLLLAESILETGVTT